MNLLRLSLGVLFLIPAAHAGSGELFDNLTLTSANGSTQLFAPIYASFSTGASSFLLADVVVSLQGVPTSGGSVVMGLYADSSTSPGALLTTIGTLNDSALTSSFVHWDFPLPNLYLLSANTRYWIGLVPHNNSSAVWSFSNNLAALGVAGEYFVHGGPVFSNTAAGFAYQMTVAGNTGQPASIAHIASGGGQWTTTITLMNTGVTAAEATLNFFDDNGNPLALSLTFPQNTLAPVTTATFTSTVNAGAGLLIETAGLSGPLTVGWAQLLSNGTIGGFAVFTDTVTAQQQQQAVVPVQSGTAGAYVLWFDNTNGFASGVALANASTQPANVTVIIRDDTGLALSTQNIVIPPLGHDSFTLAAQFGMTANLRGTLEFDTPASGQISVLGLSFNPAFAFTSIPVLTK